MAFILKHLGIYFLFLSLFSLDDAQDVQLYAYDQRFSKTKCESGLLRDVDHSVFKADFFDKDATKPYIVFVIKEKSAAKYTDFLTLSLISECITGFRQGDIVVNCNKTNDTHYHIEIQTKALDKYDGASIKSYIHVTNFGASHTVQLPQIYAPTAARGELMINDEKVQSADMICNETIDKDSLDVKFSCVSDAQPCVAEIYINDSKVGKSIKNGASYNGKIKNGEEVNMTIKYAVCRLDGQYNVVACRINASYIVSKDHGTGDEDITIIWIGVLIAVLLILLVVVILLYCFCEAVKTKMERIFNKQSSPKPSKDNKEVKAKDEQDALFGTNKETELYHHQTALTLNND